MKMSQLVCLLDLAEILKLLVQHCDLLRFDELEV